MTSYPLQSQDGSYPPSNPQLDPTLSNPKFLFDFSNNNKSIKGDVLFLEAGVSHYCSYFKKKEYYRTSFEK